VRIAGSGPLIASNVICFTDTPPLSCRSVPAANTCGASARGVMLWKLTPDQFDRFILGAAAILTVLFAVVAFALALFVF
jgi:hypothetical protein